MTEFTYTLTFRSSVSVFSGLAVAGLVDRMVVRNRDGLPCILGSSVKGRWRFFAERLLLSSNLPVGLKMHKGPLCKDRDTACTLCKLFGNSAFPSMIWVGQAELDNSLREPFQSLLKKNKNPVVHPDAELRPGIALSRTRRTAMDYHLFFDEAVPASVIFTGSILVNGVLSDLERDFLIASGRLVDHIGGRKAVGRGILDGGIKINGGTKINSRTPEDGGIKPDRDIKPDSGINTTGGVA